MTSDAHFSTQLGTVAIYGMGLIGGSIGLGLRSRRLAAHVTGIGRNPDRLAQALALGAADSVTTDLAEGVADAQIVILCSTVGNILEILPGVLAALKPGTILTDVGSTKAGIVRQAGGSPYFIGGHPMAGSERGGIEAASATLFERATWAITPHPANSGQSVQAIQSLAEQLGARTLIISPEAHDAMVAVTSHLPHVLSSALMRTAANTAAGHPQTPRLAAGGFADMTRIAASSPEIWRDICLSNRDAVLASLREYRSELDAAEEAIANSDSAAIEAFFAGGNTAKRGWGARASS